MKPELLLPAGSPEKLRYAIAYGADAVYLGLPMASLRTPSKGEQFTPKNLEEYIQYTQGRQVKAYVTLNIFAANHDIKRLVPHLEQLESLKPDALIISDPGIFRLARRHAPSIPLHISTQANTLNVEACAFWQDLGAERVILAREVPLREIAEIHEKLPDLELETFIHGSLCVAYSGRCVISDYLTDNTKNSNKGMCGNSCRWEFEEANKTDLPNLQMREKTRPDEVYTFEEDAHGTYMLNSKDLCLVEHLRKLQDAGVVSFKVEGRSKSVFYVATAGRVYREAIDYFQTHQTASPEQIARWTFDLSQAGNRGFTEGFFNGRPNDTAYNYNSAKTQQGSLFSAIVHPDARTEHYGGGVKIIAKNPVQVGDTLDWITPGGVISFELKTLEDEHGLPVNALQTNHVGRIVTLPEGIQSLCSGLSGHPDQLAWSLFARKHTAEHLALV
ncbi:MAG: U32 family peptidase [Vampirovibrionales bacterium]|nr:U32 family peptidase [Vampirovibrionales bacterium]